jgi:hypothetical protein
MKNFNTAAIALAIATLASTHAMAANTLVQDINTFKAARAEQAQSQDVYANGNAVEPTTGTKMKDLFPGRYSAKASAVTREQVRAELAQVRSQRNPGDAVEPTTGTKLSVLFPEQYGAKAPATATRAEKRAEVRAQMAQARSQHNPGDAVEPTTGTKMKDLFPGRYDANANAQMHAGLVESQAVGNVVTANATR